MGRIESKSGSGEEFDSKSGVASLSRVQVHKTRCTSQPRPDAAAQNKKILLTV